MGVRRHDPWCHDPQQHKYGDDYHAKSRAGVTNLLEYRCSPTYNMRQSEAWDKGLGHTLNSAVGSFAYSALESPTKIERCCNRLDQVTNDPVYEHYGDWLYRIILLSSEQLDPAKYEKDA